jgi:hypothetical protein
VRTDEEIDYEQILPAKSWTKSKTIKFNVFMTFLEVLSMSDQFPTLIPSYLVAPIAIVQGVGNIILRRFFTIQPLKKVSKKDLTTH